MDKVWRPFVIEHLPPYGHYKFRVIEGSEAEIVNSCVPLTFSEALVMVLDGKILEYLGEMPTIEAINHDDDRDILIPKEVLEFCAKNHASISFRDTTAGCSFIITEA